MTIFAQEIQTDIKEYQDHIFEILTSIIQVCDIISNNLVVRERIFARY